MDPLQLQAIAAIGGLVVLGGGVLWKFGRGIGVLVHLIDDMAGTKARKGVAAKPGIMERQSNVEATLQQLQVTQAAHTEQLVSMAAVNEEQSRMLTSVSHEVHFNNGSSVKDSTLRTENAIKAVVTELTEIKAKLGDQPTE